jgi:hypothetical protein
MKKQVFIISLMLAILLILTTCKKEYQEYLKPGETKIADETVVVENNVWNQNLVEIDSANFTLTFSPHTQIEDLKVGDIVVSEAGEGLLRKVKKIKTGNGEIVIETDGAL